MYKENYKKLHFSKPFSTYRLDNSTDSILNRVYPVHNAPAELHANSLFEMLEANRLG